MDDSAKLAGAQHFFARETAARRTGAGHSGLTVCECKRLRCRHENVATLLFLVSLLLPGMAAQVGGELGQRSKDGFVVLSGSINPRARIENDRGSMGGEKMLSHMTLMLRRTPEQRSALDRLLEEQQDASSPN